MAILKRDKSTIFGLNSDLTNINNAITSEIQRAQTAENNLQTQLNNEIARAIAAEQTLENKINSIGNAFNYNGTISGGPENSPTNLSALPNDQKDPGVIILKLHKVVGSLLEQAILFMQKPAMVSFGI